MKSAHFSDVKSLLLWMYIKCTEGVSLQDFLYLYKELMYWLLKMPFHRGLILLSAKFLCLTDFPNAAVYILCRYLQLYPNDPLVLEYLGDAIECSFSEDSVDVLDIVRRKAQHLQLSGNHDQHILQKACYIQAIQIELGSEYGGHFELLDDFIDDILIDHSLPEIIFSHPYFDKEQII